MTIRKIENPKIELGAITGKEIKIKFIDDNQESYELALAWNKATQLVGIINEAKLIKAKNDSRPLLM